MPGGRLVAAIFSGTVCAYACPNCIEPSAAMTTAVASRRRWSAWPTLLYGRLRLAIHRVPRSLTDTANENHALGAVVKPGKRNSVGGGTADWRHCRADIRSDLSEGVKAISGNRGDQKQTHNLDHQF